MIVWWMIVLRLTDNGQETDEIQLNIIRIREISNEIEAGSNTRYILQRGVGRRREGGRAQTERGSHGDGDGRGGAEVLGEENISNFALPGG